MELRGVVSSRSSSKPGGPPGEKEIIRLNPQRATRIMEIGGWKRLEEGTLNLECDTDQLEHVFAQAAPIWFKAPESVVYPRRYKSIPMKRQGYRYFRGLLRFRKDEVPVIVRRAVVPLKTRIEV